MEKSTFSLRLIALRKAHDMTQEELAKVLDLNRSTYTCYETDTSMPSIKTLIAIADLFHVSLDYLLGRTHQPNPDPVDEQAAILEEMQVVEMYRRMTDDHRELIKSIMREF